MRTLRTFLLLFVLALPLLSEAARWIDVDISSPQRRDSALLQVSVDSESMVRNGELISVWFIMKRRNSSGQEYYSEFDCKRGISKSQGYFSKPDGSRSQYKIDADPNFSPVPPENASEAVFVYVCGKN